MRRLLPLILLAALVTAAPSAVAAPPWSAPQDLSTGHTFVDAPTLMFSGRGTALASWRAQDGVAATGTVGTDAAARPAGATRFGPERPIVTARTQAGRPPFVVGPVPYATSRTLAATEPPQDRPGKRSRLAVLFGDDTGSFGAPRTLAVQDSPRGTVVAADAAGDAAVAWFQDAWGANDRVFVALRRPGGAFGAPVRLAAGRVRSVSVAVSPRGDVLVAWDARGTIRTRTRRAGARSFGATQTIASAPAFSATLRTAMTARGRAYVGWTAQRLTEGGGPGPFTAEVAVRPVGAAHFRPAQLLEEQTRGAAQAGVDLAVDGEQATFAWTGRYAGVARIRVVTTNAAAVFGGRQDVSPAATGALDPTLAVDGGRRLVAWVQEAYEDSRAGGVAATLAPAGGTFGPAEAITTGPLAAKPDAAFAPGGAPTVLWSSRSAGGNVPLSEIKRYAQASTRVG